MFVVLMTGKAERWNQDANSYVIETYTGETLMLQLQACNQTLQHPENTYVPQCQPPQEYGDMSRWLWSFLASEVDLVPSCGLIMGGGGSKMATASTSRVLRTIPLLIALYALSPIEAQPQNARPVADAGSSRYVPRVSYT
jgi:hypothetical protein